MTLLWCDGFDHYGSDTARMTEGAYEQVDSVFSLSVTNTRTGSHCIRRDSTSNPGNIKFIFDSQKQTIGIGFSLYVDSLPNSDTSYEICYLEDQNGDRQINFALTSDGGISANIGNTLGRLIGKTRSGIVPTNEYTHIEFGAYASRAENQPADNVCFVLDNSGTMGTIVFGSTTRWDILQSEMLTTLNSLKGLSGIYVGIVTYGKDTETIFRFVEDDSDIDEMIAFIEGTDFENPGAGTRWDLAMESAADFFAFSNQPDPIIVFSSDGEPYGPDLTCDAACKQSITDLSVNTRNSIDGVALHFIQIDLEETTYSDQLSNTGNVSVINSAEGQFSSLVYQLIGLRPAAAAGGILEIRVNGVVELSRSGIETVFTENEEYSKLNLVFGGDSDHGVTTDIDDFFIWDDSGAWNNSFLGDRRCYLLRPNQDTNISDFDPSSGSFGYKMINDDSPDDDSTYIIAESYLQSGSPLTGTSEFEIENLPHGSSLISGINVVTRASKTDNTSAELFTSINSGANSLSAAAHALTTSYQYYSDIYEYDPSSFSSITRQGIVDMSVSLTAENLDTDVAFDSPEDIISPTGSDTPYFDAVASDNPLAYYRHKETSGTTIVNSGSIGSAIDGTTSGGPTLAQTSLIQDAGDKSILFDGSNDYYITPTNATLGNTTTTNSVIECWLRFTSGLTALKVPVALREGASGGPTTEHLVIIVNNSSVSGRIAVSSGGSVAASTATYNDGNPHYVVAEKLGTTINLYVDNSLVATGTAGTLSGTNPLKLTVGNNYTTGPIAGQYYPGYVDEVAVYRTLSTARRTAHYNAGI